MITRHQRSSIRMLLRLKSFCSKKGQGIVEYAILLAFVVAVAAFLFVNGGLRDEVIATFNSTASVLHN